MGGGGSTHKSIRKVLGSLKDTTTVSLAKFNSDYKILQELDIAIVKATNHVECPAKEKYIRAIFSTISATRPQADVAYWIHGLARRLAKTHNWAVMYIYTLTEEQNKLVESVDEMLYGRIHVRYTLTSK